MPADRVGSRVELDMLGVRTLERVNVAALQPGNRLFAAPHGASRPIAVEAEAFADAPVVVDAAGERTVGDERQRIAETAGRRRRDEPERRLIGKLAAQTRDRKE
jgi:outer membrane receptor protein involved in Fe transport